MISYSQSFTDDVEKFLKKTGVEPTIFGREALGDPSFVFDLRKGRSPSARTMDKVREWMNEWKAPAKTEAA